jgi:aspartyl/glutamyl-tRNA(Asn/Gln) amidotransferase C subunit
MKEKEIEKIIKYSLFKVSKKEKQELKKDFEKILNYVEKLKKANVKDTPPTFYPIPLKNVFRKDEKKKTDVEMAKKLIEMAPEKKEMFFKVKKVL